MNRYLKRFLFLLCLAGSSAMGQVLDNNGAYINAESGAFITVNGSVANGSNGLLNIDGIPGSQAELYVSEHITNNASIEADGSIRLLGNWFNNNSFTSAMGTVSMEGGNQLISGSAETHFYNLTLDGSGLKTQEINAFSHGVLDLKHIELQTETYSFYVENEDLSSVIRTSGFVSSLNGGYLSRKTNVFDEYLFPVGSSLGTLRYRPVVIKPLDNNANTFTVRMANVDATNEGYDRSLYDANVCSLNPLFYHQIDRSAGSSEIDLNIYFDELADGAWGGVSNWKQATNQWEFILGSASVAGNPLSHAYANSWNTFTDVPYILNHINEVPVFDPIAPICENAQSPVLPTVSLNGISGTWSGSVDSTLTGTQTFTFTPDPNQCAFTAQLSVEVHELPQFVAIDEIDEILCYGDSAVLSVSATGFGSIAYQVDNSMYSTNNQFSIPSGTFEFGIIDENGCTNSQLASVTEPDSMTIESSVLNVLCPNGTGSVDLSVSGGSAPYDVLWNGTVLSEDLPAVPAGVYNALVTDDNGCEESHVAVVVETLSGEPSYIDNLSGGDTLNCTVLSVSVEAFGGSNYSWSGGSSPNTAINSFDAAGTYFVNYVDSNNCDLQMEITIEEDYSHPVIDISNNTNSTDELNCTYPTLDLGASGGIAYVWNDTLPGNSIVVDSAGVYEVTGTGSNGCENTTTIVITEDFSLPGIGITNLSGIDTMDCNTTSIDLEAVGGQSYLWLNGLGSGANYTVTSEGMYYVEGTGTNGCVNVDSIYIVDLPNPTITVNSEVICSGDSVVLIAQASLPGGNFTWAAGMGTDSSITVSPVSNDFYIVDYELNGCPSNTAVATVTVLPTPVAFISGDDLICSTQPASMTGSGSLPGGSYEWLPTNETTATITDYPMIDTEYSLIYTLNGCASDTVTFVVEVIPTPVLSVPDVSVCEGDVGTLTAYTVEPGGTYHWTPGDFTTSSISVFTDTTVSYDVTYTLNGCTSEIQTAQLIVNEIPSLTLDDIGICNGDSGILTAVPSIPGGTYTWDGYPETGPSLTVNPTTTSTYSVSYELNNCVSPTVQATVTVTDQPTLSYSDAGICIGETITLTVTPSAPGGIFNWTPGNFNTGSITVSPNATTQYNVSYDLNGCLADPALLTLTVDTVPAVTFDVSATTGCSPLSVVFTNTTPNSFDCNWSIDGITNITECSDFSFTFLDEGCYDITLSTGTPYGCTATTSMTDLICVLPSPIVDFSVSTNQVSFGSSEVDFTNNSSNAVDYIWDYGDGQVDSLIFYPGPHDYDIDGEEFFPVTLYGISDQGCTDSLQIIIYVDQDAIIFAPNSFTPDNDGLNDTWFPTTSPSIDEDFFEVQVFNRWGELIFESKEFANVWDGTYKGRDAQVGTYTYKIVYKRKYAEDKYSIVGHISLIR